MSTAPATVLLAHIRRLAGTADPRRDGELLARFAHAGDEDAFRTLLRRHGPLVWGVCRRVLGQEQDAEDAFQATFLLLARKAGSLRGQNSVGSWLYGVAYRRALKARCADARRRRREGGAAARPARDPQAEISLREAQERFDEALGCLPERLRGPLVLCHLEGLTQDEAAGHLGCSRSTLKRRLGEGRERLRHELLRRGLTLPAALLAATLAPEGAPAAAGRELLASTLRTVLSAAGQTAAGIARGGFSMTPLTRQRRAVVLLLAAGLVSAGAVGLVAATAPPDDPPPAHAPGPPAGQRPVARADPDSDGDGLSDFQEVHKYRTDPHARHTTPGEAADGDWDQRRRYTYTVRSVIRLMPPCNKAALCDDYQDARVRAENEKYVELEVISYPLNTNADAIVGNPNWRKDYAGMKEYLAPGPTTNWDAGMRRDLLRELAAAGIHPDRLTDREVVEKVAAWLVRSSKSRNMFGSHFVHFPGGRPAVLPGLEDAFDRGKGEPGWTVREQFEHEVLGREMFAHKTCGTCTSTAVYLTTVLRALGIPTRMILALPVADPCDDAQLEMVDKNVKNHQVRGTIARSLAALGWGYTNHTFNEVFVGGRWRRLNYRTVGQNVLDAHCLGLMVKVHQFNDLSEANLAATWGRRYARGDRDEEFRYSNPYRLVEISDSFGRHARADNPPAREREHRQLTVSKAYAEGAAEMPQMIRDYLAGNPQPGRGEGSYYVHCDEWFAEQDHVQYRLFLRRADKHFLLRAKGQPDVRATIRVSFFTDPGAQVRDVLLAVPPDEYAKMAKGVAYALHPVNGNPDYTWKVKEGVTVTRK
jgi:RNA polymerase sigma factor (sigma-70 family)